jgi:hypothetical protein
MLVNLLHGADLDKMETADTFTLFFDPSVHYLRRLNRLTGQVEELPTLDNPSGGNRYLTISLEGGTGDLFQLPTSLPFVMIPEPGDFNQDGTVNAADYVTWRKMGFGAYSDWRENFGQSSFGSGEGASAPEPRAVALACIAVAFFRFACRARLPNFYYGQRSTRTID